MTRHTPTIMVTIRGSWLKVHFISLPNGQAGWWFADQPGPELTNQETAIIDHQVGLELANRQRWWREAGEALRRHNLFGRPDASPISRVLP